MAASAGSARSPVSPLRRSSFTIAALASRACHARVHRLRAIRRAVYPEAFLALWREQHPQAPEQLALAFDPGAGRPQSRSLFEDCDPDV